MSMYLYICWKQIATEKMKRYEMTYANFSDREKSLSNLDNKNPQLINISFHILIALPPSISSFLFIAHPGSTSPPSALATGLLANDYFDMYK